MFCWLVGLSLGISGFVGCWWFCLVCGCCGFVVVVLFGLNWWFTFLVCVLLLAGGVVAGLAFLAGWVLVWFWF